jgi:hypothetical protein
VRPPRPSNVSFLQVGVLPACGPGEWLCRVAYGTHRYNERQPSLPAEAESVR